MKARTAHIDGLNGRESLQRKAAIYDQLLITNGKSLEEILGTFRPGSLEDIFRLGSPPIEEAKIEELLQDISRLRSLAIKRAGGIELPEEVLDSLRPGSVIEVKESGAIEVKGPCRPLKEERLKKAWPITIGDTGLEQLRQLNKDEVAALILAIRAEGSKPAESLPSTQEVIDAYLTRMEDAGAAKGYLSVRARKLRFFARQYPRLPTDPGVIRVYLRQFKTADVPTRQDNWKALSALYKFASDTYDMPNPIKNKVDKPRFKKKPGQRLSRDQAKIFLAAVETDLEWALVTCYFGLRFRRVEAERLHFGDIKSDYLVVYGKERTEELPLLPIFGDILLKLQNDRGPSDPVFPIKADTLAYHIKKIFKRAGIEGVRASPHTLNNPMLNLMRELDLVAPQFELIKPYQNTTGVRETEAAVSTYQATTDPAQMLPELLDQMIAVGETARQVSQALGGNGHRPEQLKEIIEYLEHQASK